MTSLGIMCDIIELRWDALSLAMQVMLTDWPYSSDASEFVALLRPGEAAGMGRLGGGLFGRITCREQS